MLDVVTIGDATLIRGDCREVLATLPDASVDAVVTDPPYELGFMGKAWDASGIAYSVAMWREVCRVLKPGGHLLAFGGTRTYHRMTCAIEDAGFEIRDCIQWIYGSGFPKSLDVSKAIDKRPGVTRHAEFAAHLAERRATAGLSRADVSERVVGTRTGACWNWEHHQFPEAKWWPALRDLLDLDEQTWGPVIAEAERQKVGNAQWSNSANHFVPGEDHTRRVHLDITAPATPEAAQWQGWGTALKPANEPIVVARKPLAGTVAANVLRWGTGAINIDACRVGDEVLPEQKAGTARIGTFERTDMVTAERSGRWPANVIHDGSDEVLAAFGKYGDRKGAPLSAKGKGKGGPSKNVNVGGGQINCVYGDDGSAARFFYCAKASRSERGDDNRHPTVKPLTLARYLVRLVTPPGGTVLTPFLGSGTEIVGAVMEGFSGIGIEIDPTHFATACRRIRRAVQDQRSQLPLEVA